MEVGQRAVAAAAELFQWLGLECTDEVVNALEERSKRQVARFGASGPIGSGKWMQLPPRERARIVDIAGDWLAELGYLDGNSLG